MANRGAGLRGHGESSRAQEYRIEDLVEDAVSLIREWTGRPLIVVGASIGGLLGLLLCAERRIRVSGLVLVDVPTTPSPRAAQRQRRRIAAARSRGMPELAPLDPEVVEGSLVDRILEDVDLWRRTARGLSIPTLLLRGSRSRVVGSLELEAFAQDIPHGETAVVQETGHLIARDQPERLVDRTLEFLERNRQTVFEKDSEPMMG